MSESDRPWWYSGEEPGGDRPDGGPDDAAEPGMDWTGFAAGAQRLVEWASQTVLAPHAEHDDPGEHPQCVVCRTLLLLGETPRTADPEGFGSPADPADPADPAGPAGIEWIPIVDPPRRT